MKTIYYITSGIGGLIGGFIPTLWGADGFGVQSILGGLVGGLAGIFAGYYIGKYFDL